MEPTWTVFAEYKDRAGRTVSHYGSAAEMDSKFRRWGIDLNELISSIRGDSAEYRITRTIDGRKRRFRISIARRWFGGGRYYEHEGEAQWFQELHEAKSAKIKDLIRRATWLKPLTTPQAFSEFLCRGLLGGGEEEVLVKNITWKGFHHMMRVTGTNTVLAARGMHLLSIRNTDDVFELVRAADRYGDDESWSLNIAMASWMFAGIISSQDIEVFDRLSNFKHKYDLGKIDIRDPRSISILNLYTRVGEYLNKIGAAWNRSNVNRAVYELQSATLFVSRFPIEKVTGFGGDSESSLYEEAEIKARPCYDCLDRVFVLAKTFDGARPATDAERREWCLSYYNIVDYILYTPFTRKVVFDYSKYDIGIVMHADVKCDSPRILRVRKIRRPPKGFTWWVVK